MIAIPVVFTVLSTYIFGGTLGSTPDHYPKALLPGTLVKGINAVTMPRRFRILIVFDMC